MVNIKNIFFKRKFNPFQYSLNLILEYEGGYSFDPNDPGGETKFGISKKTFPSLDIKNLTLEKATEIYRVHYWQFCKCDKMKPEIALCVFDSAVNIGAIETIKIIQQVLKTEIDGILGPITLGCLNEAKSGAFICDFMAYRALYYTRLYSFKFFGLGWFNRIFKVTREAMKLVLNKHN